MVRLRRGPRWNRLRGDFGRPSGVDWAGTLYHPSYRFARSGYSWVASALVLGEENLLLLGLSEVGLVSIGVVVWIATGLRESLGPRARFLLANPALYLGFLIDTAEPLAVALLTLALVGSSTWSAVGLAVVRPSYLVALANKGRMLVLAVLAALAFRLFWVVRFGDSPGQPTAFSPAT